MNPKFFQEEPTYTNVKILLLEKQEFSSFYYYNFFCEIKISVLHHILLKPYIAGYIIIKVLNGKYVVKVSTFFSFRLQYILTIADDNLHSGKTKYLCDLQFRLKSPICHINSKKLNKVKHKS